MSEFMRKLTVCSLFLSLLCLFSCKQDFIVEDTTPPSPVTNVKTSSEDGKIIITWDDPLDSDLYGIKIYNPEIDTTRKAKLNDGLLIGKGVQKYEASGLENGKYYSFKISAVDDSMNESSAVTTTFTIFNEKVVVVENEKEVEKEIEVEVEVKKYICPVDGKQFDTAEEAAECCGVQIKEVEVEVEVIKTVIEKPSVIPFAGKPQVGDRELSSEEPTVTNDSKVPTGNGETVTMACFGKTAPVIDDKKDVRNYEIIYKKFQDLENSSAPENFPVPLGAFTISATEKGFEVTHYLDPLFEHATLHVYNRAKGIENAQINVHKTEGKGSIDETNHVITYTYTYPFVTAGDEYDVWYTCSDNDWGHWWDWQDNNNAQDSSSGRITITATGGIGNYYFKYDDFEYDNQNLSIVFNNLTVMCPDSVKNTAIFNRKQIGGTLYCDGAWRTRLDWSDKMYLTNNRLDLKDVLDLFYHKSKVFIDCTYPFNFENENYECKVLGKNGEQLFDDNYQTQYDLTANVMGGTMDEQYEFLKYSIQKNVERIENETTYDLPIIYVTTRDSEEVLEKEYYDCYVEMFNCPEEFEFTGKKAGIKVRGNSTADTQWVSAMPYRIKFEKKQNMLGLHEGKKYKSWVLLNTNGGQDYIGFNLARKIYETSTNFKYYASDCTFVHIYVNGEYRGMRLLCEQSQVGKDRVDITELAEGDGTTLETGYFLMLDNYAWSKQIDTPAFSLNYADKINFRYQDKDWQLHKPMESVNGIQLDFAEIIYNEVLMEGYLPEHYPRSEGLGYKFKDILGHDIENNNIDWNNGGGIISTSHYIPEDQYSIKSDTYSREQINYIAKWFNNVWEICYQAIVNSQLYEMNFNHDLVYIGKDDDNHTMAKGVISKYVDLESLMNEFILEELVRDNDVGAGSFYMAVDFTKWPDEKYGKLTFDCPWDFNWGYNSYSKDNEFFSDKKYYAGAYQPLFIMEKNYLDRSNFWFTLFNTAPWFRKDIRARWNKIPKEEMKTLCDTLVQNAALVQKEGGGSVDAPANFVKKRVDEIDRYLWLE